MTSDVVKHCFWSTVFALVMVERSSPSGRGQDAYTAVDVFEGAQTLTFYRFEGLPRTFLSLSICGGSELLLFVHVGEGH